MKEKIVTTILTILGGSLLTFLWWATLSITSLQADNNISKNIHEALPVQLDRIEDKVDGTHIKLEFFKDEHVRLRESVKEHNKEKH